MEDIERGADKNIYLYGSKRTSFEQKNKLPPLQTLSNIKRLFTFSNGHKVEANHVVISGNRVEFDTIVHDINPRNQNALNDDAVRDILETIRNRGVNIEAIAVKKNDKYFIIEGSRRRYCCIQTKQDLPLWVISGDITSENIYEIINASQSTKKFSYREVGQQYLKQMQELGFTTNEALGEYLNISTESIRKRIQAAKINDLFIQIFPDPEGIPNNYYSRLAKIEKELQKNEINPEILCEKIKLDVPTKVLDNIEEQQRLIMNQLSLLCRNMTTTSQNTAWDTHDLMQFENKDKYARISRSYNGRKIRFEFNRLNSALLNEIELLVTNTLKKYDSNNK